MPNSVSSRMKRSRGFARRPSAWKIATAFSAIMQAVWEKGRKYNTPIMLIVLLVEHGYYRNLTRSEILWEVSHSLVYGVKRMSYFTYWLPAADDFWKYDNAMTDAEGRLQPHYYDVSPSMSVWHIWVPSCLTKPAPQCFTSIRAKSTADPSSRMAVYAPSWAGHR